LAHQTSKEHVGGRGTFREWAQVNPRQHGGLKKRNSNISIYKVGHWLPWKRGKVVLARGEKKETIQGKKKKS